jgi:hypothetical protein
MREWPDTTQWPAADRYARARVEAARQILGDRFTATAGLVVYNPTRAPWPADVISATALVSPHWDQINKLAQSLIDSEAA